MNLGAVRVGQIGHRAIFFPPAKEQLRSLAPETKRRIREGIRILMVDPRLGKPLRNQLAGCWRFRAQRYRIIYRIKQEQQLVEILFIGHRREIYRIAADAIRLMESRGVYRAKPTRAPLP